MSLRPRLAALGAAALALGLTACADDVPGTGRPSGTRTVDEADTDPTDGVARSVRADGLELAVTLDDGSDPGRSTLEAGYRVTNTSQEDMLLIRGIGTANPTATDLAADPAAIPSAVEVEGDVMWLTSRSAPISTSSGRNARGIVLGPGESYSGRSFADLPLVLPDDAGQLRGFGVCIEYGTAADGGATTSGSGRELGRAPSYDGEGSLPLVLLDLDTLASADAEVPQITVLCSQEIRELPAHALPTSG